MAEKSNFKAVILSGGSGERFWPLSTSSRPKQFLRFFGEGSLIAQTARRFVSAAGPNNTFVLTTKSLAGLTRRLLKTVAPLGAFPAENVIAEPCRRNTAAAVKLGVAAVSSRDDDIIGFFPSDQLVGNEKKFLSSLKKAMGIARKKDVIVTIGIKPEYPSSDFGYIDREKKTFVEKPSPEAAEKLIGRGCLWNAGIFIARKKVFDSAFGKFAPEYMPLASAKPSAVVKIYRELPSKPFDTAVMEPLSLIGGVEVVEGDFGWDDVGSLLSFERHYEKDALSNVAVGEVRSVDSYSNILVSDGLPITTLGVGNLVVVATKKEVFVAAKSQIGQMRKLFT